MKSFLPVISFLVFCASCAGDGKALFTEMTSTGIDFINEVEDTDTLNILDYPYYYNGAGVATGDINNDGLPDIFLASNHGNNRLYLNKGDLNFEDITSQWGGLYTGPWTTGVTMADVNGDGFLDIYVSVTGNHEVTRSGQQAHTYFKGASNKLFINQQGKSFADSSEAYGLNIKGYNTHAVFFDADKDGDLDLFQLQHSVHQTAVYGDSSLRRRYSESSGGKYYQNMEGKFIDKTRESGIISSALGYGLGVAVADFNQDGWDDIYVGNDFHENDYYYLNRNGKFEEQSNRAFGHTSNFSMGNDVADINNDGWPDIITLDMLPADEKVLKSSMGDRPLDTYKNHYAQGYNYQNARNCLQLNTGAGMAFSDIGLYSGIAATDWSWSPLFADYNLDGHTDLFITNGIKRRLNDLDYIKFTSSNAFRNRGGKDYDRQLLEKQPPGEWHNYFFEGSATLRFRDQSKESGMEKATLSNGAAWADLDGDGDLDLVVNNFNQPATILRNNSLERDGNNKSTKGGSNKNSKEGSNKNSKEGSNKNWIKIKVKGAGKNTMGIGTKVFLFAGEKMYYQQLQPSRGFMSSVEPVFHFSTGVTGNADSLLAIFPGNRMVKMEYLSMNQFLTIDEAESVPVDSLFALEIIRSYAERKDNRNNNASSRREYLEDVTMGSGIDFVHRENDFNDFNRQWFIPHQYSAAGPPIAVADVNGDGLEDCFFGNARNKAAALYFQQPGGNFTRSLQPVIESDSSFEDVDALFFDADNDGDPDLFIASGGNELRSGDPYLKDRIYFNDGKGNFNSSSLELPPMQTVASATADVDKDGYHDIIIIKGLDAFKFDAHPAVYVYRNKGMGNFMVDSSRITGLPQGILTDVAVADLDKNGSEDIIITGEWMEPMVIMNDRGKFGFRTIKELKGRTGWWQSVSAEDYNGDGHTDLMIGNYGLNSKLSPAERGSVKMYLTDIDRNGTSDQLLSLQKDGNEYPFLGKEDLEKQLPYLRKKFLTYESMAGKTMEEIFGGDLQDGEVLEAVDFRSVMLINDGKGNFREVALDDYFQMAPLMEALAIRVGEKPHLLAAGNFSGVNPYEGKYDALFPVLSQVNEKGVFGYSFPVEPSLRFQGEVRTLRRITIGNHESILVGRNNDSVLVLRIK